MAPTSLSWTPEELRGLDSRDLDDLARGAGRSLVMGRLLLGRCLVELDRRSDLCEWGFSSAIHYAVLALRLSRKAAREMRRVARDLLPLPVLSAAAEEGEIGWSHLREVVRVATPDTEEAWLEAARTCRWKVFHRLVQQAEPGDLPGEASREAEAEQTELRLVLSADQLELLTAGLARLSRRFGRMVQPAEGLEYAFAELLAGSDADLETRLGRARDLMEDLRELQARQERLEDGRALAAARRARRAAGGTGPTWVAGERPDPEARPTRVCDRLPEARPTRVAQEHPTPDERPTRVAGEGATLDARPTRVAGERPDPDARPTRVAGEDANADTRPTWVAGEEATPEGRPTRVAGELPDPDARPIRVCDRTPARPTWAADAPSPRPPFAYPAPASGDSLLRDGLPWEEDHAEPRASWAMVSANEAPCPGNPALTLATSQRRPFWEAEPEPVPAGNREARRAAAIHRGARTRRGSAETRRTVLRRDGFACMTPGCPHTVWLHSHHLTLYCLGGLSVPAGLVTLCSKCHRNVHRGFLRILGTPETGLVWLDRRGLPLGKADPAARARARRHARCLLAAGVGVG